VLERIIRNEKLFGPIINKIYKNKGKTLRRPPVFLFVLRARENVER
jgi:hypothetical protein